MAANGVRKRAVCYLLSMVLVSLLMVNPGLVTKVRADAADQAAEFDTLRNKRVAMLTGGTNYDLSDPSFAASVSSVTYTAQNAWDKMDTSPTRTYLFGDLTSTTVSTQITTAYGRLKSMALAYRTYGSSLENNTSLRDDIISGLDWMYANRYNENASMYGGWFDWEIGAPLALNDVVTLLYHDLDAARIQNYMNAIHRFTPAVSRTGANRTWQCTVIGISGILLKDAGKVTAARDGLSEVLAYVNYGDGFYADGSFVQHAAYPYNGGYGKSLLSDIATIMYILNGSTYQVTDVNKDHVYQWVYDSFEMFIYNGRFMDMVRGREMSRDYLTDLDAVRQTVIGIMRLAQIAPPSDAAAFKSMVKYWLQINPGMFGGGSSIDSLISVTSILTDTSITPRMEISRYKQYNGMDRAVLRRPGFGFGISMFSNRIANYEGIASENLKGWHTADGMTYLYNGDVNQYKDYWPTVNSYRLPGTTVLKDTAENPNLFSDKNWVGGTDILGLYGVTGMDLHTPETNLSAKKSWFMFDDEIVALGSDINSTDNKVVETIVDNRKLNSSGDNSFSVNGVSKSASLGWSETMTGTSWVHLAGNAANSDVGYYFPGTATVHGLREARTGNWREINNKSNVSNVPITNNFLNIWVDHGTNPVDAGYSYVILPNKTAAEVGNYAVSPNVTILENSKDVHAVKETGLNIIGANFWNDMVKQVDMITSNKKASIMTKETTGEIEISVSDPTHSNTGRIDIEIDRSATGLISADTGITVTQYRPTIKFSVDVNASKGKAFKARFNYLGTPSPNPTLPPDPEPTPAPTEIIVDNIYDEGFTSDSVWTTNNETAGFYGADYAHDGTSGADATKWAQWTPRIGKSGYYDVYMRWTAQTNRPDAAPLEIKYEGGLDTYKTVNQRLYNAEWVRIGNYNFAEGTDNYVKLLATDAGYTVADAVKFVYTGTPVPIVIIGECEDLITRTSLGDTQSDFSDTSLSGGKGNKFNGNAVDDYVEYDLTVPASGTYNMKIKMKKGNARGKFKLYLPQDQAFVGGEQDSYAATDQYAEFDLGEYTFTTPGTKQFRLVITGKNTASTGYTLGNDYIKLTEVQK